MALITRLSRLFQADFHAVLDSIEEPDIQLKQAVREMEFDLQQDEHALSLLQRESEKLLNTIDEYLSRIAAFDGELDICFTAGKDDLARDLIKRKLEAESIRANAKKRLGDIDNNIDKLQQRIGDHHQQLDNIKQKLELLIDGSINTSTYSPTSDIRNEDIEIAFLREKQRRATS